VTRAPVSGLSAWRSLYLGPWRIDVEVRRGVRSPASVAALARSIRSSLEAAGAPSPASIGLILADDRELAALNREHMGEPAATDVLSFPLLPEEAFAPHVGAARPPRGGPTGRRFVLPPGRRVHLGEIVVSVERAIAQAEAGAGGQTGDVRWSARDEMRLLVTHGALHVCGWDHADPAEEAAMRALERDLLAAG
jgi:probable rRNA maturation factor